MNDVQSNLSGWPLPDEYLLEIGRVSVAWAELANMLRGHTGQMAQMNDCADPASGALLARASFLQQIELCRALYMQRTAQHTEMHDYQDVLDCLARAHSLRNKFVHNALCFNPDTKECYFISESAEDGPRIAKERATASDIRDAALAIAEAQVRLHKLMAGNGLV